MMKGLYISIIGIDGTGKTTICNLIQDSGYGAVFTKEPYLSIGRLHVADSINMSYVFAHDRHLHMKDVIIPALNHDKIVICDRGLHCNLAYQNYEGASIEWIMQIQSPIMIMPDLVIWLVGNPVRCAYRSRETDCNRMADIQQLYSTAIGMTPDIPVLTINIEHADPADIARVVKKRIEELKR